MMFLIGLFFFVITLPVMLPLLFHALPALLLIGAVLYLLRKPFSNLIAAGAALVFLLAVLPLAIYFGVLPMFFFI